MLLVLSTDFSYRQAIVPSATGLSVDLTQSRKRWTADSEFADIGFFEDGLQKSHAAAPDKA